MQQTLRLISGMGGLVTQQTPELLPLGSRVPVSNIRRPLKLVKCRLELRASRPLYTCPFPSLPQRVRDSRKPTHLQAAATGIYKNTNLDRLMLLPPPRSGAQCCPAPPAPWTRPSLRSPDPPIAPSFLVPAFTCSPFWETLLLRLDLAGLLLVGSPA